MRLLKYALILLLVLAAILFGGGMLVSPQFSVARSIEVQAPPEAIYPLVADPRKWPQWSAWNRRDPAMQMSYSGAPIGAGAGWAWRSESQGSGRMAFLSAEPPNELRYELHFDGFDSVSRGAFRFEPTPAGATRVTWSMNGDMGGNPLMRWFALGADSMIGGDFEAGLANLKALAERR